MNTTIPSLTLSGSDEGGRPARSASPPGARPACGWVFPPDDVFDEPRLLALLRTAPGVSRLKGVFRLPHEWVAVNRVGSDLTVSPTAYRRDSRVEVFADSPDWDAFERDLVACRLPRPADARSRGSPGFRSKIRTHAALYKSAAVGSPRRPHLVQQVHPPTEPTCPRRISMSGGRPPSAPASQC